MKTKLIVLSILAAAASLGVGCTSVTNAYNSAKRNLTKSDMGVQTNALYAQVPDADKARVSTANDELELTKAELDLAELEQEYSNLLAKRNEYNTDRLGYLSQEKTYRVQLAKLEAIDRNELGDKINNVETIAEVHIKALKIQQKRVELDSKVTVLDVRLQRVEKDMTAKEAKVESLKGSESNANNSPVH